MSKLFKFSWPGAALLAFLFFASLISESGAFAAYLLAKEIDLNQLIGSAPQANSPEDKKDLLQVENWQKKRSTAECARAQRVAHVNLAAAFGQPDGPLTAQQLKHWNSFFAEIKEEAEPIIDEGKNHWRRPRPFLAHSELHPCFTRKDKKVSYSFPSGHATLGRLYALVLAELDPTHRKIYLERGDQIAADRVLAGVHYPSDIEAGKKLGETIFKILESKAEFRQRLEKEK